MRLPPGTPDSSRGTGGIAETAAEHPDRAWRAIETGRDLPRQRRVDQARQHVVDTETVERSETSSRLEAHFSHQPKM